MKLFRYLDGITLVVPLRAANPSFEILRDILTTDGMILSEDTCVAYTTNEERLAEGITAKLWDNAGDHSGFTACGLPIHLRKSE